jgi:hypothetical protein
MPRIPRQWTGGARSAEVSDPAAPDAAPATDPTISPDPSAPAPDEQPKLDAGAVSAGAATHGDPVAGVSAEAVTTVQPAVSGGDVAGEPAPVAEHAPPDATPGLRGRARMRRRLRYLHRRRELAFRDLGGLVFDLHRFGRDRGDLVARSSTA